MLILFQRDFQFILMPSILQKKGLRRNEDAISTVAGIKNVFISLIGGIILL